MKTTFGELRELVNEAVSASPKYMKKESVRAALQELIMKMVSQGDVPDQTALDDVFGAVDMSVKALKMVPFEVWQRMGQGNQRPTKKDSA